MVEIWKDIIGYEGLYQIGSHGNIKSLSRDKLLRGRMVKSKERLLVGSIGTNGYPMVILSKNDKDKTHVRHRLVACHFIGGDNTGLDVNHIDGNKKNNNLSNLEFCTRSENIKHAYRLGLFVAPLKGKSGSQVYNSKPVSQFSLSGELINTFESCGLAKAKTGICHIECCAHGRRNHAGGYKWKFIDK